MNIETPIADAVLERCYRLEDAIPDAADHYRRLALVSQPDHLAHVDLSQGDTLIVACSWLLWQECAARKLPCVHLYHGTLDWDCESLSRDIYLRCNDWVYIDGKDVTMFHGVSLGRKFMKEIYLLVSDFERLNGYLRSLVDRYEPEEIILFDFRTDYGELDEKGRYSILEAVTKDNGISLIDHSDRSFKETLALPGKDRIRAKPSSRSTWKGHLRNFFLESFECAFGAIGRISLATRRGRPRVLALTSQLTGIPLIENFNSSRLTPVFLAKWFPFKRNIQFLAKAIRKNIILVTQPQPQLSKDDKQAVDAMRICFENAWQSPTEGRQALIRRYVKENILKTGRLYEKAAATIWAERILDRMRPSFIFTDGLQNPVTNCFLELGQQRGIGTAAIWHAHYMQDIQLEIFGCDPRVGPLVDTCFTWGEANEKWLDSVTDQPPRKIRTGNPISGQHRNRFDKKQSQKRVLVLQYPIAKKDLKAQLSHEYTYFVGVIRRLNELGYSDIRLKLHPNIKDKQSYYRQIAKRFGFSCEIAVDGEFASYIEWADFVIGPATSGAMLEVIGAGKTYYPVILPPTSVDLRYLQGTPIFQDFDSLRDAIAESAPLDQRDILNYFTSYDEIENPALEIWKAIDDRIQGPKTTCRKIHE